jgi:hypothetical protein
MKKLVEKLKKLYIKFQTVPLIGLIMFMIYMAFKSLVCYFHGVCLL